MCKLESKYQVWISISVTCSFGARNTLLLHPHGFKRGGKHSLLPAEISLGSDWCL